MSNVIFNCDQCGNVKARNLAHYNRTKKHFCSRECRIKYNNPSGIEKLQGTTGISVKLYGSIHRWIITNYGKAKKCSHCVNPSKKYEWALIKGCKYEYDINNYFELCPSCHRKYDETEARTNKIRKALLGHTANNIKGVVLKHLESGAIYTFSSIKIASETLNISKTGISNVLTNRSKTVGGYICQYK